MPEADAVKAVGKHNQKFGSSTKNIVCGDKLCSDVKRDGKANQQSRFQVGGVAQQGVGNNDGKVTICHEGKNTISVSGNAVSAHLEHGDIRGACSDDNNDQDETEDSAVNDQDETEVPTEIIVTNKDLNGDGK